MSKMDTQGMSPELTPEEKIEWEKSGKKQVFKSAIIKPRRILTPTDVMELKILIHEVLDEREGKFDYTSYFETEKYKHPVTEDEPDYNPRYKPAYYQ